MKDVDKLLANGRAASPRRKLHTDFTDNTMRAIRQHKKPSTFSRLKESISMKLHKPAYALAAVMVPVGITGATYATVQNWPQISAVFSSEKQLKDGNRVVSIDATNCGYFTEIPLNGATSKDTLYYEVRKESKLTNEQLADMIQGVCEQNIANQAVNTVIKPYVKTVKNITSGGPYRITKLDDSSIHFAFDHKYDQATYGNFPTNYNQFRSDFKVYDGTKPIQYSDLQPSDSVMFILEDLHSLSSETDPNPNHFADPKYFRVAAIIKVPALTGNPDAFYTHLGKDFVRTEPCDTNGTGFCRQYPFDDQMLQEMKSQQ